MNPKTPRAIALWIAVIFTLLVTVCFIFFFRLLKNESINIAIVSVLVLIGGLVSFIITLKLIEKFLYQKIKIIYKNIHTFKSQIEKKPNIILREDVLHDVESEVSQWVEEKIKVVKQLKETDTFRKEYIGNLAHELKTPLFGIQGYLETLMDDDLEDKERVQLFISKANRQADRLSELILDLDMITKLESGAMPLNQEKFDLIVLVQKVMTDLEDYGQTKNIRLFLKEGSPRQLMVFGDASKIEQVLTNLISNSIHYGQVGGEVKIRFYDMEEHILCEVADNGIGIAKEHLPRIFERFYRVDKSRSRHDGGSGLGLAICKHIIEAHQETLTVRSTEGIGSTFAFTLRKA
jgi:two-component system phosphate regulon sensor histidine kinase PhoR